MSEIYEFSWQAKGFVLGKYAHHSVMLRVKPGAYPNVENLKGASSLGLGSRVTHKH